MDEPTRTHPVLTTGFDAGPAGEMRSRIDHRSRGFRALRIWPLCGGRGGSSLRPHLGTREPAEELFASVRSNAVAHTWGAVVHVVATPIAAVASLPAALWIFGLGLLLHVYPVLLQMRTHWRLQALQSLSQR